MVWTVWTFPLRTSVQTVLESSGQLWRVAGVQHRVDERLVGLVGVGYLQEEDDVPADGAADEGPRIEAPDRDAVGEDVGEAVDGEVPRERGVHVDDEVGDAGVAALGERARDGDRDGDEDERVQHREQREQPEQLGLERDVREDDEDGGDGERGDKRDAQHGTPADDLPDEDVTASVRERQQQLQRPARALLRDGGVADEDGDDGQQYRHPIQVDLREQRLHPLLLDELGELALSLRGVDPPDPNDGEDEHQREERAQYPQPLRADGVLELLLRDGVPAEGVPERAVYPRESPLLCAHAVTSCSV